jgi:hypothetical protein
LLLFWRELSHEHREGTFNGDTFEKQRRYAIPAVLQLRKATRYKQEVTFADVADIGARDVRALSPDRTREQFRIRQWSNLAMSAQRGLSHEGTFNVDTFEKQRRYAIPAVLQLRKAYKQEVTFADGADIGARDVRALSPDRRSMEQSSHENPR